jgi:hypothetical protein
MLCRITHSEEALTVRNGRRQAEISWGVVARYLKCRPPRPVSFYASDDSEAAISLRPDALTFRFTMQGRRFVFPRGFLQRLISRLRPDLYHTDSPDPEPLIGL